MRDMFKNFFGYNHTPDKLRINEYQLDEWKKTLERFLCFKSETDVYIYDPNGMPLLVPNKNKEYDDRFAFCCDRFIHFEALRSPENQANQLFSACYAHNGIEETLRRALIFTEKIRPENDVQEAMQMLYDHYIVLLMRLTQDAVHEYDAWPFERRQYGMDVNQVLQFIRAECQDTPGICDIPRAWETLLAIEQTGKTDRKTWSWLSGVMEEFGCRSLSTDSLQDIAVRIAELTHKRIRIIERGEVLRAFFKDMLTPEFFASFDPESSAAPMDAARAQEELGRVYTAYAKACGMND